MINRFFDPFDIPSEEFLASSAAFVFILWTYLASFLALMQIPAPFGAFFFTTTFFVSLSHVIQFVIEIYANDPG